MCLFSVSPAGLIWSDRNSTNSQSVSQETRGFRCRQHHHRCSCWNYLDENGANLLPFMGTSHRIGDIKGNNTRSSSDRERNDGRGRHREGGEKGRNWRRQTRKKDKHNSTISPAVPKKANLISPITVLLVFHLTCANIHAGKHSYTEAHKSLSSEYKMQKFSNTLSWETVSTKSLFFIVT